MQARDNEDEDDGGTASGDYVSEPTKIENFNIATLGMGNKRRLLPQRETASI